MLPHVAAEDRLHAVHQRVLAVGRLGHLELAVLDREPGPARAELRHARLDEVGLHLVEAAVVLDERLDLARHRAAAAVGLHPVPEVGVIVVLAHLIDDRLVLLRKGFLADLVERHRGVGRVLDEVVAGVDVGEVVLVVVELERLLRHVRGERVVGVGQIGEGEGHGSSLSGWRWSENGAAT